MLDPDHPSLLVDLDGTLLDRTRPLLAAHDLGVLRGDGVFEALRVIDGRPDLLDEHLARLARSAAMLDMAVPGAERWRGAVAAAAHAWRGGSEMVARLIATRGTGPGGPPTCFVLADPVDPEALRQRAEGVRVVSLTGGLLPAPDQAPWLLLGAKSLSYAVNMAAQRWARAHDADDAVFVTGDGYVLEAPTAAVLVARGRTLRSPPPALGILPSITAARALAAAEAAGWTAGYAPVPLDELRHADGVWLVSSVRGTARVHTLDGAALVDSGLHEEIVRMVAEPRTPGP